jgi:hypothetical protein
VLLLVPAIQELLPEARLVYDQEDQYGGPNLRRRHQQIGQDTNPPSMKKHGPDGQRKRARGTS